MAKIFLYVLVLAAGKGFGGTWKSYAVCGMLAIVFNVITPLDDAVKLYALASPFLPDKYQAKSVTPEIPGTPLQIMADQIATNHGIDPLLFRALVNQESRWDVNAVSYVGASGLTQLMPETAKTECNLGMDEIFHPEKNLDCGARYFAAQLKRFGSVDLALAAYNSGPDRVAKLGRVPRIRETQNYVTKIMADWRNL